MEKWSVQNDYIVRIIVWNSKHAFQFHWEFIQIQLKILQKRSLKGNVLSLSFDNASFLRILVLYDCVTIPITTVYDFKM